MNKFDALLAEIDRIEKISQETDEKIEQLDDKLSYGDVKLLQGIVAIFYIAVLNSVRLLLFERYL